ncbi:MAG: GGDEF domain-containing protein, partial [Lachnospiraceae bacterium]|nr:GGDEF domain-containing protein [Lachnospiraceae bacterium]
ILFDIENDHVNYCETMNVLGIELATKGNETAAIDHYLDGLDCATQHNIRIGKIPILNNIGSKYQELGDDKHALEYLLQASEIIDGTPPDADSRLPLWKLVIDMNIANAYRALSQYEKAREYLDKASDFDVWKDEENAKVFYLSYQVSRASLLWDLGERDKAEEMIPELVDLSMKDRNVSNYRQDIMDLLTLLEKLGDRSHWEVVLQSFEQYALKQDSPEVKIASLEAWIAYFKYFELKDKYKEACVLYTQQSLEMKAYKNRERTQAMDLKVSMREKDITTRKYQALANLDALTGTGNRHKLETDSAILFQNAIRENAYLTVGIFDLDHFKKKNDAYGHLIGDAYMTCLVRVLEKTLGTLDNVYRFGGDEFIVILTDKREAELKELALRVQKELHDEQLKDDMLNGLEEITVSQGYAFAIPEEGDTILDLLDAADKALYQVKEGGRNNFAIYDYRDVNEAADR